MKSFQQFLTEVGTDTAQIAGFSRPLGYSSEKKEKKSFKDFKKKKDEKEEKKDDE